MRKLPVDKSIKQSGQALLIILLVMSVVLAVVLSIIARSVTDVGISVTQDDSIRAFNAAEAGIEKAIIGGTLTDTLESGASYTATSADTGGGASSFLYPTDLNAGESATFWFVRHTTINDEEIITCSTGNCVRPLPILICWGENGSPSGDPTTPAISIEIYYNSDIVNDTEWDTPTRDYSDIKLIRATSDPNSIRRTNNNHFKETTPIACTIGTKTFAFKRRIYLNNGAPADSENVNLPSWNSMSAGSIIMAKAQMLYNTDRAQPIGMIIGGGTFPPQGRAILSTGRLGDTFRKLSVFQGYPEAPFAFNNAVYSGSDLAK